MTGPVPRRMRCQCGHDLAAHEHLRRGLDCGLCSCRRFRPAGRRWRRVQ